MMIKENIQVNDNLCDIVVTYEGTLIRDNHFGYYTPDEITNTDIKIIGYNDDVNIDNIPIRLRDNLIYDFIDKNKENYLYYINDYFEDTVKPEDFKISEFSTGTEYKICFIVELYFKGKYDYDGVQINNKIYYADGDMIDIRYDENDIDDIVIKNMFIENE